MHVASSTLGIIGFASVWSLLVKSRAECFLSDTPSRRHAWNYLRSDRARNGLVGLLALALTRFLSVDPRKQHPKRSVTPSLHTNESRCDVRERGVRSFVLFVEETRTEASRRSIDRSVPRGKRHHSVPPKKRSKPIPVLLLLLLAFVGLVFHPGSLPFPVENPIRKPASTPHRTKQTKPHRAHRDEGGVSIDRSIDFL